MPGVKRLSTCLLPVTVMSDRRKYTLIIQPAFYGPGGSKLQLLFKYKIYDFSVFVIDQKLPVSQQIPDGNFAAHEHAFCL